MAGKTCAELTQCMHREGRWTSRRSARPRRACRRACSCKTHCLRTSGRLKQRAQQHLHRPHQPRWQGDKPPLWQSSCTAEESTASLSSIGRMSHFGRERSPHLPTKVLALQHKGRGTTDKQVVESCPEMESNMRNMSNNSQRHRMPRTTRARYPKHGSSPLKRVACNGEATATGRIQQQIKRQRATRLPGVTDALAHTDARSEQQQRLSIWRDRGIHNMFWLQTRAARMQAKRCLLNRLFPFCRCRCCGPKRPSEASASFCPERRRTPPPGSNTVRATRVAIAGNFSGGTRDLSIRIVN